jgi:hypothetical protein
MVSSYYIDQKEEKKRDPFLSFRYFSHGIVRASPHCFVVLLVEMRIDGPSLLLEHQSRRVLAMPLQSSLSWELGWERAVLVNAIVIGSRLKSPAR